MSTNSQAPGCTSPSSIIRGMAVRVLVVACTLLLAAGQALAVVPAKTESELAAKTFYTRALRPQPWSLSLAQIAPVDLENHGAWQDATSRVPARVFIDRSTGNPSVFEGRIEEWIPGAGNSLSMADVGMSGAGPLAQPAFDQVEPMARDFLLRNRDLLKVDLALLRLNAAASGSFGNGRLWRVTYDVFVGDVKVEGAFIQFVVNSGNLIQVMTQHLGNLEGFDASPGLDLIQAGDVVSTYIGGFRPDDVIAKPQLAILPATLELGSPGLGYRLVYHVDFRRNGEDHSWRGTVDAKTGELLGFVDRNDYAVVDGGVWPVAWRVNNVLQAQQTRPMPFVQTTQCGVTDLAGVFTFCGAANNEVRLNGQYVTISDGCGAVVELDDVNNDFRLGDNSGDVAPGDCYVPAGHSVGDTASAREQFYHVNLIKEKGRRYYPANAWLQGNLTANVNIAATCNAFWNGTTINFYRSGGGCGNTGEEIAVSLHEWGHGFDANDGFPSADQGTGEAMGDTMAMTQSHDPCVGWGFRLNNAKCGGYGNACTICDGVRDVDYARHVNNSNNAPHAVRDNWNGIAGTGFRDGAGFECANNASYQGPCGTEGHCESYPMSTANWDLPNRDLPEQIQPAGPPYNTATMSEAWDIWDRFWWESRLSATSGYQCPGDNENTADGCAAGTYYTIYRAVDDADGNLANGTPHAASIFSALYRHSIHCGLVGDAANQNNSDGCPSLPAPTLTATSGVGVVALSWTTIANATQYRVMRNELSCTAGFTEIAIVNAPTTTYNDANVANGTTYYYQVVPIANAGACFGTPSACQTATPTNGPSIAYVAGSAIVLSDTGDGDLYPDNCETVTARITILNDGNASVNNARITNITSPDASVAITSTFPIVSAGSLAVGATTTLQFTFTVGAGASKAVAFESLDFTATLSCDTCAVPSQ